MQESNLDGTYPPTLKTLEKIKYFFLHLLLSLTSTEFYNNIISSNKESVKKHIIFCCVLSGILFTCFLPMKLYQSIPTFKNLPTLHYDGKNLTNNSNKEPLYFASKDNENFVLVATEYNLSNINIERPVSIVFTKDTLLYQMHGGNPKDLNSYVQILYPQLFGNTAKHITSETLNQMAISVANVIIVDAFFSIIIIAILIVLLIALLEYIFIATLYKHSVNLQFKSSSPSMPEELFYKLNVFNHSIIFVLLPTFFLLFGWYTFILLILLFFLCAMNFAPIFMQKD